MTPEGYPDDAELKQIENWSGDFAELLEFVRRRWKYPDYFRQRGNVYEISTGGWSGNEDMIYAMEKNFIFWSMCWVKSERGGHYVFEIPGPSEASQ